jgi:hypothetical protein
LKGEHHPDDKEENSTEKEGSKNQRPATRNRQLTTKYDADVFRHVMGATLTLRKERLRRSMDAYKDAREVCREMEGLIKTQLGDTDREELAKIVNGSPERFLS